MLVLELGLGLKLCRKKASQNHLRTIELMTKKAPKSY